MDGVLEFVKEVVGTIGAALVIALLGYALAWAKAQLARLQNDRLRELVGKLVQAAEQKLGAGGGKAKYAWVAARLRERGIIVDPADIEAEVYWISRALDRALPGPAVAAPEPDNYEPTEDGV